MTTTRYKKSRRGGNKSRKQRRTLKATTGKRWTSAISAASRTLTKTGSLPAARESLRRQALFNAHKLFGRVGI